LFDSTGFDIKISSVFAPAHIDFMDKTTGYRELEAQLRALLADERDPIANLANAAALIFHALPDLNWAGFYRLAGNELVLGPFQGRPACVRIRVGQGVCGTAAAQRETVLVPDVNEFPGHIACDAASRSEIVVPLLRQGRMLGVLDLDSPVLNRFDAADQAGLEELVATLVAATDW
jgi:GAF domain-containing protein